MAEPLIKVPKSNCLGESKARRGCDIWTSSTAVYREMCSLTKDKTTPVSKETGLLGSADWINIALDWLVAVYFLRANQRHLSQPQMQRSSISTLPFPLHTPFLHPDNKVSQSVNSLSFFLPLSIPLSLYSVCNLRWLIGASPSEVLSDPPGVTVQRSRCSLQP